MDKELQQLTQLQESIINDEALLVYFYSNNCAPCKSLRPKVEELLAKDYPKMNLYFVNSEDHPEMTAEYGIFSMPTLLAFFDRKEYIRKSKYVSIPELKEGIDRYYQMMFE